MPTTILFYEDDPNIRLLVTDLLEENGYTVIGTDSLQEGEAEVVCRKVDLFLADSDESSKERALEVYHRICGVAERDIPVIIFTAHRVLREEAEEAGCADVIQKPFDIDDLLRQIEQNLKQPV